MRKLKVSGDLSRPPIPGKVPKALHNQCWPPELTPCLYFLISRFIALLQSNQSIGGAVGSRWYPTAAGLADLGVRGGPTLGSEQAQLGAMTLKLL